VAKIGDAAVTALKQKGDKFVDTAGNVYTVLTDATGAATSFVMDTAGVIFDTSKMVGQFIFEQAADYPGELLDSIKETGADLNAAFATGRDAAAALGQFAKDARPELPPLNQMHKPKAWAGAITSSTKNLGGAFDALYDQAEEFIGEYEDKYCTPATFTPSTKLPGEVVGPSFFFEVGLGGCTVNENSHTKYNKSMVLDCYKPYLTYGHRNATWTSKYHSAPSFTSKECKIEKVHGEYEELVLFVFDGKTAPNMETIGSQVSNHFTNAVNGLATAGQAVASQVTSFLSGLPNPHDLKNKEGKNIDDLVKAYEGYEQPSF